MSRAKAILKHVSQDQRGIEIGPWCSPLAPKRDGYNCLAMDVFDTATLRARAAADPFISAEHAALIEDVDIVGSAVAIGDVIKERGETGQFDYIVSSHNFEHLPNPIRFLNGCEDALRPGGILSMAIPDHRTCFDFFRPITRLSDWIQSLHENSERPSMAQAFEGRLVFAHVRDGDRKTYDFSPCTRAETVACEIDPDNGWHGWTARIRKIGSVYELIDKTYIDTHCSVFTPSSFELLIRDCGYLGLIKLAVLEVEKEGCEFHVHLRKSDDTEELRPQNYPEIRTVLLHRIRNEEAENSIIYQQCKSSLEELQQKVDAAPPVVTDAPPSNATGLTGLIAKRITSLLSGPQR